MLVTSSTNPALGCLFETLTTPIESKAKHITKPNSQSTQVNSSNPQSRS
jgi:hypothetical protein